MKKFAKYFFGFWFFAFLLFSFWQINDPDPEIWVTIYLGAAVFALLAFRERYPLIPLVVVVIACLAGAIYFYPESVTEWVNFELENKDLSMKTQQSEEARETFGFLIVAAVLTFAIFMGWRKGK